jgi:hypothetical protein
MIGDGEDRDGGKRKEERIADRYLESSTANDLKERGQLHILRRESY